MSGVRVFDCALGVYGPLHVFDMCPPCHRPTAWATPRGSSKGGKKALWRVKEETSFDGLEFVHLGWRRELGALPLLHTMHTVIAAATATTHTHTLARP